LETRLEGLTFDKITSVKVDAHAAAPTNQHCAPKATPSVVT
jgi:hypothetical protein